MVVHAAAAKMFVAHECERLEPTNLLSRATGAARRCLCSEQNASQPRGEFGFVDLDPGNVLFLGDDPAPGFNNLPFGETGNGRRSLRHWLRRDGSVGVRFLRGMAGAESEGQDTCEKYGGWFHGDIECTGWRTPCPFAESGDEWQDQF